MTDFDSTFGYRHFYCSIYSTLLRNTNQTIGDIYKIKNLKIHKIFKNLICNYAKFFSRIAVNNWIDRTVGLSNKKHIFKYF